MRKFSSRSWNRLQGVHPDLVEVTNTALQLSSVDFGITQGLRTVEQQREYVRTGKSKTMKSRHLTGHAVDVIAYVNGKYTYEPFDLYTQIAEAFRAASVQHKVPVLWGAAWLRSLDTYSSASVALSDYVDTRRTEGRKPFLDGPHFQLTWKDYPV
jgi:peptidoglycan L-alanyl-D-glutamate endopeptidase CwlK